MYADDDLKYSQYQLCDLDANNQIKESKLKLMSKDSNYSSLLYGSRFLD